MGLLDFLGLKRTPKTAYALYQQIVAHSRSPVFYLDMGVPDTLGGRFDLVTLHAYVVMRRLKELDGDAGILSQQLFDVMFADMDGTLREMGVGDLSVSRKVKDLAKSFYGRIKHYDEGMAGSPETLGDALRRNLFADGDPTDLQIDAVAGYIRQSVTASRDWSWDDLANGKISFSDPNSSNPTGQS